MKVMIMNWTSLNSISWTEGRTRACSMRCVIKCDIWLSRPGSCYFMSETGNRSFTIWSLLQLCLFITNDLHGLYSQHNTTSCVRRPSTRGRQRRRKSLSHWETRGRRRNQELVHVQTECKQWNGENEEKSSASPSSTSVQQSRWGSTRRFGWEEELETCNSCRFQTRTSGAKCSSRFTHLDSVRFLFHHNS